MLHDLYINLLTLITFLFIMGNLLRTMDIDTRKLRNKILIGIMSGILSMILMLSTIKISGTNTILDLRNISIILASYYGILSAIVTGAITVIFRFSYFGFSASSFLALFNIFVTILICWWVGMKNFGSLKKWMFMSGGSLIVTLASLMPTLYGVPDKEKILISYSLIVIVAYTIVYYFRENITLSNLLYSDFKIQAYKDFLTGLNNVRQFYLIGNSLLSEAKVKNEALGLIMIDIDCFKLVNDKYGHTSGDAVLQQLGNILFLHCSNLGIASRNGGEEFTILLPKLSKCEVYEMAENIRKNVEKNKFILPNGEQISITISAGVSVYPDFSAENLQDLVCKADEGLYEAKRTGRNKICYGEYNLGKVSILN